MVLDGSAVGAEILDGGTLLFDVGRSGDTKSELLWGLLWREIETSFFASRDLSMRAEGGNFDCSVAEIGVSVPE